MAELYSHLLNNIVLQLNREILGISFFHLKFVESIFRITYFSQCETISLSEKGYYIFSAYFFSVFLSPEI